jgi:uncharacterized UBP type Zn finger protein
LSIKALINQSNELSFADQWRGYKKGQQQDAHEVLLFLLDTLSSKWSVVVTFVRIVFVECLLSFLAVKFSLEQLSKKVNFEECSSKSSLVSNLLKQIITV